MAKFSAIIKRKLLRKVKRKKKFVLKNKRLRIRRLLRTLKKNFVKELTHRYIYRAYLRTHLFQKTKKIRKFKNKKKKIRKIRSKINTVFKATGDMRRHLPKIIKNSR